MMTTMAALLGGPALMLGPAPARSCAGRSASGRRRLLVSQILTLFTTPVCSSIYDAEPVVPGGRGTAAGPHAGVTPSLAAIGGHLPEPATGTGAGRGIGRRSARVDK